MKQERVKRKEKTLFFFFDDTRKGEEKNMGSPPFYSFWTKGITRNLPNYYNRMTNGIGAV